MIKAKSYSRTTILPTPKPARFRYADLATILVVALLAIFAFYRYNATHGVAGQVIDAKSYMSHDLATALDMYKNDTGSYPSTRQGLDALVVEPDNVANWHGPYLADETALHDPWNMPYQYAFPGHHNARGQYDIWSMGPDQKSGTSDDVGNW
jgi:general secretion pathway protein G